MSLAKLILDIIAVYKPPRRILHSLVYLYSGGGGLRWGLGLLGPYSPIVDRIVDDFLREGVVKICRDGRLTLDDCPSPTEDWDASPIVSQAVMKYLIDYTLRYFEVMKNSQIHTT